MQKQKNQKKQQEKSNGKPVGSFGSLNEGFIPTPEQSQEIISNFKSIINSRLDKLYSTRGADGEMYAYAIAVNQVKKKAEKGEEEPAEEPTEEPKAEETPEEENKTEEPMGKEEKLKEMIQAALSKPLSEKKKTFPDLTGDGKVTKADILKGRGVIDEYETDEELIADEPISETDNVDEGFINDAIKKYGSSLAEKFKDFVGKLKVEGKETKEAYQKLVDAAINGKELSKEERKEIGDQLKDLLKLVGFTAATVLPGGIIYLLLTRVTALKKHLVPSAFLEPKTSVSEDMDIGHQDDEPGMLKADLYRIGKYAMELYKMVDKYDKMENEVDFPHWWQAKITKSKEMMVSAKHYLDFEMKEPEIDSMVGVASEEGVIDEKLKPSMGAGAYVDDFKDSKAPQFKGKSKKKKQQMAVAAYLSAKDKKKVAEAVMKKLKDKK